MKKLKKLLLWKKKLPKFLQVDMKKLWKSEWMKLKAPSFAYKKSVKIFKSSITKKEKTISERVVC